MSRFQCKYRCATDEDLDQLQQLGIVAYGQFRHIISEENWQQWESTFTDGQRLENLLLAGSCHVCEYGNRIIGMAFFIPHGNPTELFSSDWAYLRLVGVHPDFEGQGIGRQLTQLCIDQAQSEGERILALHTSEFQPAARHIYESMGFSPQRELLLMNKKYWIYTLHL